MTEQINGFDGRKTYIKHIFDSGNEVIAVEFKVEYIAMRAERRICSLFELIIC